MQWLRLIVQGCKELVPFKNMRKLIWINNLRSCLKYSKKKAVRESFGKFPGKHPYPKTLLKTYFTADIILLVLLCGMTVISCLQNC